MNILETILEFLNHDMRTPVSYQSFSISWFHYLALTIAIICSVIAIKKLKNASDQEVKRFLLGFSILLLSFEAYKQLIFSYQQNWNYPWYIFPFQFCSTPMYVGLIAGLTNNVKVRQACINFLGTFGLFAGTAVMLYPNDVFITTIGINIQTMIHHGSMMVVGMALLASKVKLTSRSILSATLIFTILVSIAIGLNYIHNTYIADGTFNMFFINPLFQNHLPVLSIIEPLVPHPVFVLIYIVGFAFVAYLMLLIRIGIQTVSLMIPPKAKLVKRSIS